MNRVGMVVDCSHCSYRTSMEAIEASESPAIFSHANARKLCDHERNIWDDQIKACAEIGGGGGGPRGGSLPGAQGAHRRPPGCASRAKGGRGGAAPSGRGT